MEGQVFIEAEREFQRKVAVQESEREKVSKGLGERNEEVQWVVMVRGPKWWGAG